MRTDLRPINNVKAHKNMLQVRTLKQFDVNAQNWIALNIVHTKYDMW